MEFKPVKTSRLYEEVIKQIKKLIIEGDISPGDKFPPERELAKKLNISRGVLREAFRVLEARGLVESRRGGGRYLRDYNQQNIYQSKANFINMEKAALLDIAEAREMIETQIIKKAVYEATMEDIERVEKINNALENADEKTYRESDLDLEFHLAIARATHNFALYDLLEAQIELLIELEQKHFLDPKKRKELCDEHRKILKTLKERDAERAAQVMSDHLNNLIKAINEI
ncbi:MAG: FadR/GntR family transcriptional regulator [Bacillota bacterium]